MIELFNRDPWGTKLYQAPEMDGKTEYDRGIDVFAIGITIYYLLTGIKPKIYQLILLFTDKVKGFSTTALEVLRTTLNPDQCKFYLGLQTKQKDEDKAIRK